MFCKGIKKGFPGRENERKMGKGGVKKCITKDYFCTVVGVLCRKDDDSGGIW